ncbi:unnamed protein product [Prorocentrum cordatum]|uniref:Uncharacterized protein n=1 Tax=Prorocentrum cordatum TaxID=2364126 RepID=A0ABN9TJ91_9DINO|nr:unnamed protein product [Polarella glacialis]
MRQDAAEAVLCAVRGDGESARRLQAVPPALQAKRRGSPPHGSNACGATSPSRPRRRAWTSWRRERRSCAVHIGSPGWRGARRPGGEAKEVGAGATRASLPASRGRCTTRPRRRL